MTPAPRSLFRSSGCLTFAGRAGTRGPGAWVVQTPLWPARPLPVNRRLPEERARSSTGPCAGAPSGAHARPAAECHPAARRHLTLRNSRFTSSMRACLRNEAAPATSSAVPSRPSTAARNRAHAERSNRCDCECTCRSRAASRPEPVPRRKLASPQLGAHPTSFGGRANRTRLGLRY